MKRGFFVKFLPIVLGALLLMESRVHATHIRAGEIIATRVSNSILKYRFSIIGYTDTGSTVEFGGGDIDFGDGTVVNIEEGAVFGETIPLGDEIAYNVFEIEHTFPGFGKYTIRFNERNRNAGVLNMSNSVDTPFYVETELLLDPVLGANNTPVFLVPPVDEAAEGARFIHNPGAFDPDDDSLAYRLVIPKQFKDRKVDDYVEPNDPQFYTDWANGNEAQNGRPTFQIDSITGDLVWDAPGLMGEYNIAFVVEEWRKISGEWFKLGFVTRDMQIIVKETDNERPEIDVPPDLCVEAGTPIGEVIVGTDPDGHPVKLEAFGGPFELQISPARVSPNPALFQPQPAQLAFNWQTDCNHVKRRPYEIQFKVTDQPEIGPKLVDFKTWRITVVAPAPTGLTASVEDGRSMRLNWDPYDCGIADKMQIWRRVDSYDFQPEECTVGMPDFAGYELVTTLDDIVFEDNQGNTQYVTTYIDDNNGLGLSPGANYCYRIVAEFPEPTGGESFSSNEACNLINSDAPITINVDVNTTDKENGEVMLRWYSPFEADPTQFPRPYSYQILRSTVASGSTSSEVIATTSDTTYVDTGLNTTDNVYRYTLQAYDNNGILIGHSASASAVRLELTPSVSSMELSWSADVPWSNNTQKFPRHYIYRDQVNPNMPENLILIDSVDVSLGGFRYVDDGSFNGEALVDTEEYCYYIQTQGSYGNTQIIEPLLNRSQEVCGQPNDLIPPCTPVSFRLDESFDCESFLDGRGCFFSDFENKILWTLNEDAVCQNDVRSFNVYFSNDGFADFELLENVTTTSFTHGGLSSFKGCYKIAAVDRSGNVSQLSEMVCNDNCPNFEMPNVFTPNGDNINDVFSPYVDNVQGRRVEGFDTNRCPRFVRSVDFKVFDRSGSEVFAYNSGQGVGEEENGILINWTGESNAGIELASGVYYYSVEVTFDVLDPTGAKQVYSGWVQLLR